MFSRPVKSPAEWSIVIIALLAFYWLALDTAGRKSITTDEPLHLTHSIAMSQTGVMSIPEMHTPLTYRLIGSLLLTEGALPDVTALATWATLNPFDIGRELFRHDALSSDRVVWLGRFIVANMGVMLGALMAGWTRSLTRNDLSAVAVVMALFAFSPNFLASAALATTDIASTATAFACVYAWWRYWRRPGAGRWLAAAVCLGLALAAKLTGVILLPVTFMLAYANYRPGRSWWRPALVWLSLLPVAGLLLWALYGFEIGGGLPMPAYWEAWRLLLLEAETSPTNFFLGRVLAEGSWFYFPVSLLLKTPLPQLGLFLLIPFVLWRERRDWRNLVFPALPAAVYLAVAIVSRINFGYRHVLPAIPFLIILGATAVPRLRHHPAGRVALVVAMVWAVAAGLLTHPDHLTYFNELALGRGHRYLGDSNLDWGQDLNQLAEYARQYEAESGRPLFYSYTGNADPARYGLPGRSLVERFQAGARDFPAANPPPGRYAINVSDLQGPGLTLGVLTEPDLFDWFRRREPLTTLGGSIFIYDVPQQADGTWIAHCLMPGPLLAGAEAERLVGRHGLRHVRFDCEKSWVFPDGGGPGWYILPLRDEAWWLDDWLTPSTRIPPAYTHAANQYGPAYAVYYWDGGATTLLPSRLFDTPGEPLLVGEAAELSFYATRGNEWLTLWRATAATGEPLSILAHLLRGDEPPQNADGLGFSADQWRPGDWFVQRHIFDTAGDTMETGLYNYVTLEPASERIRLARR